MSTRKYRPIEGSPADRMIGILERHPGVEVSSRQAAKMVGTTTKKLHTYLSRAHKGGAIRMRLHEGRAYWSKA